jgi:pilus assembly protein CpaF
MANLQAFERSEYQQVKADLHRKILDRLDLEKLGRSVGDAARDEVLVLIRNSVNSEAVPLSFAERERLSREILTKYSDWVRSNRYQGQYDFRHSGQSF